MHDTPLFTKLCQYTKLGRISFAMPGHKGGRGISRRLKKNPFRFDVTELEDTENLHQPRHAMREAKRAAAEFFGSLDTFFLVNGSTAGIYAMLASSACPGDTVLINRACHVSVINACTLLGLRPIFIEQDVIDTFSVPSGIDQKRVVDMLDRYPDTKAVLVTSPSYYGICSDIETLSKITHTRGIPLLVDEAHGAHFAADDSIFPRPAVVQGADMAVQSAHKTLNALNQASYLQFNSDIVDKSRVKSVLAMLQTSSPSYVIAASADLARSELAESGRSHWNAVYTRCERLRETIQAKTNIQFISMMMNGKYNIEKVDETRIVMNFSAYDTTGFHVASLLRKKYRIDVEMADLFNVVCIATPANRISDFSRLASAAVKICSSLRSSSEEPAFPPPPISKMDMPPQKAFYSRGRNVRLDEAVGCVSRCTVVAYPPAIPIVCTGETVSAESAAYISALKEIGAELSGLDENGFISIVD